jgi:hypothetical protein
MAHKFNQVFQLFGIDNNGHMSINDATMGTQGRKKMIELNVTIYINIRRTTQPYVLFM